MVEIPRFKLNKKKKYYEMLNSMSEQELEYLNVYAEFMKSVMEGLNKKSLGE